ncbi:MAG: D-alanyl-D-alanine carboxypeptidase/D-alanyl-D-alanine-endopeptidase [Ilumatobacteraceae bacterium]
MSRRAGNPVIVAVSMAVSITMVLLVAWQWAEASRTVDAAPTIDAPADPTVHLTTPLLSFRRAPGVLSRTLNVTQFRVQLSSVLERVGSSSCVAVAVDGNVVSVKNERLPVIPASNQKLIVAATSLALLGEGYTFRTTALGELGPDGVVQGDLTLVGGGDPLLTTDDWLGATSQTYPPINTTRLEQLADDLVAAGVTRVAGRVVGDGSRYDDQWYHPTWDAGLYGVEGGPLDALMVNDGWLRPVFARPSDAAADPVAHAADVFTQMLRARGIPVSQGSAVGAAPAGVPSIAEIESQPLWAIVQEMLLTSDDNTAEMLVKELGSQLGAGGTTDAGLAVVRDMLAQWELPLDGVVLVDGSGLSRDNRVTCSFLVGLLGLGRADGPLGAGLPVAGTSGTLVTSFVDSPVTGRLQAKTGTLSGVKSLSGYLPASGGDQIEFALVLNEPAIDDGGFSTVWDALATSLVTYPSRATTDQLAPR